MTTHLQRDVALLTSRQWNEYFADGPMTSDVGGDELGRGLPRTA